MRDNPYDNHARRQPRKALTGAGRLLAITVTIPGLTFVGAPPAQAAPAAGVLILSNGTLQVTAENGARNQIDLSIAGDYVWIQDNEGEVVPTGPNSGCFRILESAICLSKDVQRVEVTLGDGDDSLLSKVPVPVTAHGGTGDDVIIGHTGESGPMTMFGNDGNDSLIGGPDNDSMDGGLGRDLMAGGPAGVDAVSYRDHPFPVSVTLDNVANDGAQGEKDDVQNTVEHIGGGQFNDTLIGSDQPNQIAGNRGHDVLNGGRGDDVIVGWEGDDTINGEAGNDILDAGPGVDNLYGADGDDTLASRDGTADRQVDGGNGLDTCYVDTIDPATWCEVFG